MAFFVQFGNDSQSRHLRSAGNQHRTGRPAQSRPVVFQQLPGRPPGPLIRQTRSLHDHPLRTVAFLVALAPVCVVQTTAAHADADDAGFHLEQITDAGELARLALTRRIHLPGRRHEPASDLLDSWHEMAANRDMFLNVGWTTIGPADFLLWHDQCRTRYTSCSMLLPAWTCHCPGVARCKMTNDRRPRFLNLWVHDGAESGHLQGRLIARCSTPGTRTCSATMCLPR